jgi:hypothetical protein
MAGRLRWRVWENLGAFLRTAPVQFIERESPGARGR